MGSHCCSIGKRTNKATLLKKSTSELQTMEPQTHSITFDTQDGAGADLPFGGMLSASRPKYLRPAQGELGSGRPCLHTQHAYMPYFAAALQISLDSLDGARVADISNGNTVSQHPEADNSSVDFHKQATIATGTWILEHGVTRWRWTARGRAWCRWWGMSANSWDGSAMLHVNPYAAMRYYFLLAIPSSMLAAYMCTGARGEGHMYYVILVPVGFYTTACTSQTILFWRWGPTIVHHKLYKPFSAFAALGTMPLTYVGYLGPEATVPWHNDLHWLVVSCLNSIFTFQVTSAGGLATEHPAEPRTSIREPVLRSAVHALMFIDACTDLAVTRSFVRVVRSY